MGIYIADGDYIRYKHDGKMLAVRFCEDMEPESPRQWDPMGKMICWHGRYRLGDQHDYRDPEEFLRQLTQEIIPWQEVVKKIIRGETRMKVTQGDEVEDESLLHLMMPYIRPFKGEYEVCAGKTIKDLFSQFNQDAILKEFSISEMTKMIQESNEIVLMPLWLYDHSGISMSVSHEYPYNDRWDSGQVGWIFVKKDRFLQETGCVPGNESGWPEKAYEMLQDEVKTYDQYLRGEVFGFQAFVFDDDTEEWEETDGSWGYYGDDLEQNGILDSVVGLREALQTDQYETGRAHEITTITYEFD